MSPIEDCNYCGHCSEFNGEECNITGDERFHDSQACKEYIEED